MIYQWRSALDEAIARNSGDAHHRYIQLATPGEDGYPANRTVVFRGFLDDGALSFVTDSRSAKVRQVGDRSGAEICWYFTRSREQFRLRGQLEFFGERSGRSAARVEAWSSLSEVAREQFFWATPGAPAGEGSAPDQCDNSPPASFLLAAVTPERVDHLRLAASPQRRYVWTLGPDGDWQSTEVNP